MMNIWQIIIVVCVWNLLALLGYVLMGVWLGWYIDHKYGQISDKIVLIQDTTVEVLEKDSLLMQWIVYIMLFPYGITKVASIILQTAKHVYERAN